LAASQILLDEHPVKEANRGDADHGCQHSHGAFLSSRCSLRDLLMRPQYFDLPEQLAKDIAEWKTASKTDPDKVETQANSRAYGKAIVHWCRLRMK
jgi:hypothetical protein